MMSDRETMERYPLDGQCDDHSYLLAKNGQVERAENGTAQPVDAVCEQGTTVELENHRNLSNVRVCVHLIRFLSGASMFSVGKILANGGLVFGPVCHLAMGYLNVCCNLTFVNCNRILCKRLGRETMTYEDTVEESFKLYGNRSGWARAGKHFRIASRFNLFISQFGVSAYYIKIIATVVHKLIKTYFPAYSLSLALTALVITVLLIPYSWLRNLRVLFWFSLAANILVVVCIVTTLQYEWRHLMPETDVPLITEDPWNIPRFMGASLLALEGIPMIMPIENSARHPEDYGGLCGMIMIGCSLVLFVNDFMGISGMLAFGEGISGNVLVDLPPTWYYNVVIGAMALLCFLTFVLHIYVPSDIALAVVSARWSHRYTENVVRTVLVILAYCLAAIVPGIDLLMSLVGACGSMPLVFGFPPLVDLLVINKDKGYLPWTTVAKDAFLLLFGVVFYVTGTIFSIQDIVAIVLS